MNKRILGALLCWLSLLTFGARAQTTILATETFEAAGTDFGYSSNSFNISAIEYFERRMFTGTGTYTGTTQVLSSRQGSYTWTGEGVRGTGPTNDRSPGYVVLNPILNSANYKNFVISVAFAAPRGGTFMGAGSDVVSSTDRIRIQYSFNGGAWTTAALLMGNNRVFQNASDFEQIVPMSDSVTVGNGSSTPPNAGTILDQTYRDITATLPSTAIGANLRVRVVLDVKLVEVAFDNIRVTGVLDNVAKPTLTNIEQLTAATYTEGGSPVQLTNTLQVGYSDNSATNITGGTVTLGGTVTSQDQLNFATQGTITGSYNAGVLTLSGTASQAAYQTALRSITYSNSNSTTLASSTRPITFQLYTGATLSTTASRNLTVTAALNAPMTLNYTESFDADGEGTRYFGNPFVSTSSLTGFFRATTSPATANGTTIGSGNFTGWSGGYWFGEGNDSPSNPTSPTSTVQLAPVNASGRSNIRFTIALGAAGNWLGYQNGANPGDSFELFYRINGGTPVKFGAFYGVSGASAPARQDTDLDRLTPATGTQLTSALQDFTFTLPASAAVGNLDFLLVQSARAESEIAFDNIRITAAVPPTVATGAVSNLTTTSATVAGTLSADGGAALTSYGVVYVQGTGTPTTSNSVAVVGTSSPGSFPANFTANLAGLTAGTQYTARAYATNGVGTSYGANVTFTTATPTITLAPASPLPGGTVATAYSQTITASGGTAPYTYAISAGALPSGLSLASSGTLSGTPTAGGTFTFTVRATDASAGAYSGTQSYSLTIAAPTIVVSPASLPAGTVGAAYSQTMSAAGGTAPYVFAVSAGALPAGLTLSATGTLSGTPTAGGSFTFTIRATDSSTGTGAPYSGSRSYTLTIAAPTITVAPATLPGGTAATAYSTTITASGGTAPYSFAVTAGALPAGLNLALNGILSGTPTASGTFNFTVTATDASTGAGPYSGSRAYSLTIAPPAALAITPVTLPNGTVAAAYSQAITASGGTAPYTYAVTAGALPAGLNLTSGGVLAGTPTAGGSFTFTITATDASTGTATTGSRSYTLTIAAPTIAVAPATLPNGTVGTAYSQTVTASGGTAPYTYNITAGALPAGLNLALNGTLSGTPTASGSFTFTITSTDASAGGGPYTGSQSYTVSIAAPASVTWVGNVSPDWFTAANWSPSTVPTAATSALIPTGTVFSPLINSVTATTLNLTLNSGATLNMSGGTLDVRGNLTSNGTFLPTGGTVVLGTTATANILGSSRVRFWDLTVNATNAQLGTSAGASVRRLLTLNGNFATQGNTFVLESDAANTGMVYNNGGIITGTATFQRYISPATNPGLGYRHVSAPVSTATVGSLATAGFTPVVNPAYNTAAQPGTITPFPTVYGYDQSRLTTTTNNLAVFDKGWFSPASTSDVLTVGKGYTANIPAGQTLAYVGTQNNGTYSQSLTRSAAVGSPDQAGWQLVGNPYPSPLNYSLVDAADRVNLDAAIYVFASTGQYTGNYRSYVNGVGGGDPVLAMGQGFFARVSAGQTNGSLTFRNSQRVTTYSNPTYQRTSSTRPLVQLSLKPTGSSSLADDLFVYFEAGATDGFDSQFDAEKMPNTTGLNISASLSATQRLSIDGHGELGTAQRVVPLAVGVPAAGSYTLDVAQLLNLTNVPVYLRDLQTGALTDLAQQPSYQFAVSNASALITGRFELVFSPQQVLATAPAALVQQVALYPTPAATSAWLELPASLGRQTITATLLDAVGREVRTLTLPAQGTVAHQLDLHQLATGIYALRLNTSAGIVVKKLVVE